MRTCTSPRRSAAYPDALVHRAIKALLAGKKYDAAFDWQALGRHAPETAARDDCEPRRRELAQVLLYMRDHVGETFSGTITAAWRPSDCSSRWTSYFVDGLVHISSSARLLPVRRAPPLLRRAHQEALRLTDPEVKLVRVDVDQRKMDLVPA